MFTDYVPLLLINMAAGYCTLAAFVWKDLDSQNRQRWAPPFTITGLVALLCGLHMVWHWPLPGSYNVAFGQMSVLLGVLFLAAALACARNWDLGPLTIYAFFAGLAGMIIGIRIISLGMTKTPYLSGAGFIVSGLAGVASCPALHLRGNRALRMVAAVVLVVAALIWACTAYPAYWAHLEHFAKYLPPGMQVPKGK